MPALRRRSAAREGVDSGAGVELTSLQHESESRGAQTPALTKRRRRRETAAYSAYMLPHDGARNLTLTLRLPYAERTK
jgi:hypothetical protein